jgi:uncharacterized protein YdhG (YjbR/CyaY superfamily)
VELKTPVPKTVDEYIGGCPVECRAALATLRAMIREIAPEATEKISYGMPAFFQNGILVYFAAHKRHIGLYALPKAIEAFADRLASYTTSKGTIQFPIDRDLPLDLIRDILRFRVEENAKKTRRKKT